MQNYVQMILVLKFDLIRRNCDSENPRSLPAKLTKNSIFGWKDTFLKKRKIQEINFHSPLEESRYNIFKL
jgi:hypothetical protein